MKVALLLIVLLALWLAPAGARAQGPVGPTPGAAAPAAPDAGDSGLPGGWHAVHSDRGPLVLLGVSLLPVLALVLGLVVSRLARRMRPR